MKIAILQLNFLVGDLKGNTSKIIQSYNQAVKQGADLVVASELALFGYPPKDMLLQEDYLKRHDKELNHLQKQIGKIPLIIGIVDRNKGKGKPLFNSVAFIQNHKIKALEQKTLLPTYDVFDEYRYFESKVSQERQLINYQGQKIALALCEDIWTKFDKKSASQYQRDPIVEIKTLKPDLLIVPNSSPYYLGKGDDRLKLARNISRNLNGATVVYVNQIGANDDLIFDGRSFVVSKGKLIAHAKAFEEEICLVDTNIPFDFVLPWRDSMRGNPDTDSIEDLYHALVLGIKDYLTKINNQRGAVIALSGGIDSAVTAALAVAALGSDKVKGYGMPSAFSSQGSIDDAQKLAQNLDIKFELIAIKSVYKEIGNMLHPSIGWNQPGTNKGDVTEENIQARIRGLYIMAVSNRTGAIVLSTGNKSEIAVGYCTLYGDMVGGFAVLSDVPKTLVYKLAHYINRDREIIPTSTINKAPSAELAPGQKDEDSLPPYHILDPILKAYIEEQKSVEAIVGQGFDRAVVEKVVRMVNLNEFKRKQMTIGPKVTTKAFGFGRRWPIAARQI